MQPNTDLTSETISHAIAAIEAADLAVLTIEQLESMLWPLFRNYHVQAPVYDPGLRLFRGRICETKPIDLRELGSPPKNFITRGRANDAGESVFYAATIKSVPFFELRAKPGDFIAVSRWITMRPVLLNHVGFSNSLNAFAGSSRAIGEIYDFVQITRGFGDANALLHDYLARKFARFVGDDEKDYYKMTNAIGRRLFKGDPFDGLLYPTIQMQGNADNIVLKEKSAESLKFLCVEWIHVKEQRDFQYDVEIVDSAAGANAEGVLEWSGRGLQWKINRPFGQIRMEVVGGDWVGYDEHGQIVEPI